MSVYSPGLNFLLVAVATLTLSSCKKTGEEEQKGLFVIHNQSGRDVTLTVFSTQDRRKAPLTLSLPNGNRVERVASGGAGAIAYPELFFQGDSVKISFSDGKQLVHYCTQAQQISGRCAPAIHNILSLREYTSELINEHYRKYTYTLTQADYAIAY
jgi:hypothetical protein